MINKEIIILLLSILVMGGIPTDLAISLLCKLWIAGNIKEVLVKTRFEFEKRKRGWRFRWNLKLAPDEGGKSED